MITSNFEKTIGEHFILGTLPMSLTVLYWLHTQTHSVWVFWVLCAHHIHIITQQLILFPKSQHLGLRWENPIGAAHFCICFSIQQSTVLQTAFVSFKPPPLLDITHWIPAARPESTLSWDCYGTHWCAEYLRQTTHQGTFTVNLLFCCN